MDWRSVVNVNQISFTDGAECGRPDGTARRCLDFIYDKKRAHWKWGWKGWKIAILGDWRGRRGRVFLRGENFGEIMYGIFCRFAGQ